MAGFILFDHTEEMAKRVLGLGVGCGGVSSIKASPQFYIKHYYHDRLFFDDLHHIIMLLRSHIKDNSTRVC